jgi:hypothetical protein
MGYDIVFETIASIDTLKFLEYLKNKLIEKYSTKEWQIDLDNARRYFKYNEEGKYPDFLGRMDVRINTDQVFGMFEIVDFDLENITTPSKFFDELSEINLEELEGLFENHFEYIEYFALDLLIDSLKKGITEYLKMFDDSSCKITPDKSEITISRVSSYKGCEDLNVDFYGIASKVDFWKSIGAKVNSKLSVD